MTHDLKTSRPRPGNPLRWLVWGGIAGLVLLPAVAMRFTREVNWTPLDFIFAGIVLGLAGVSWEVAARTLRDPRWRICAALAIIAAVLLVWAEAAAGIAS